MVSRWFVGLRGGVLVCLLAFFSVAVAAADAKQVVTGHAEISGAHGTLSGGDSAVVFAHKAFARVTLICTNETDAINTELRITNLENKPLRVTYTLSADFRVSDRVDPHDSKTIDEFSDPDVGISDPSHKYATMNINWGRRLPLAENKTCDYAVHTILHFPDGTPLNG
ncbi:MAG: hypothetical protein ACJ76S_07765 [Solirubrobacteraceae bacterium]